MTLAERLKQHRRIARDLALAAAVGLWLAVVTARALQMIDARWLWVLAPLWVAAAALVLFIVAAGLLTLAMRFFLWLVKRAERRRRAREILEMRRALDDGLRDLVGGRPLHFREQPPAPRRPRA